MRLRSIAQHQPDIWPILLLCIKEPLWQQGITLPDPSCKTKGAPVYRYHRYEYTIRSTFPTVRVQTGMVSITPDIRLTALTASVPEPVPAERIEKTQCTHTCSLAANAWSLIDSLLPLTDSPFCQSLSTKACCMMRLMIPGGARNVQMSPGNLHRAANR